MAKKNTVVLSFNYTCWSTGINETQMTRSISKMKKIIGDDIKNCLVLGYKKRGENEVPLKLSMPFFATLNVTNDMKIKIDFDDACKFKYDKFSNILKTRNEYGEITVDGKINVTVIWNV